MAEITPETFDTLRTVIAALIEPKLDLFGRLQLISKVEASDEHVFASEFWPLKTLYIIEDEDADVPTLRIEDIILADDMRGKGLGSEIIEAIKGFCADRSLDLNLSANPMMDFDAPERPAAFDRLIRFYERLGFVNESTTRDGNMIIRHPEIEMQLSA